MFYVVVIAMLMGMVMAGTEDLPEYRLPGDVIPNKYVLEVVVDVCNKKYNGVVYVEIKCIEPTSTIKLHSKGLTIGPQVYIHKGNYHGGVVNGQADKKDGQEVDNDKDKDVVKEIECTFTLEPRNDFLIITVPKELEKGMVYTLNIPYQGELKPKEEGLYLYESNNPSEDPNSWYVATNVRTRARFFFPCFDEPAMRATFILKVQHYKYLKAISTMSAVNEEQYFSYQKSDIQSTNKNPLASTLQSNCRNDPSNMVWEEFYETPRMSPHKLGLVVGKLSMVDLQGVARLWYFKHKPMQTTTPMFNLIPKIYKYFVNNFDLQLPLPKLDVIVLENTKFLSFYGAIVVPTEMVLSDKLYLTAVTVISHGLASQWIDGIVCIKWWSDLWLTWALTEYMATTATRYVLQWPELTAGYDSVINYDRLQEVYKQSDEEDRPVYTKINRPEEIYDHWETIAFKKKGPLVLRMLHLHIGTRAFCNGMLLFLHHSRMTGSCVDHTDFWDSFEPLPSSGDLPKGMTVDKFMHGWITQTGFPMVTLTRNGENNNGALYISQKHYRRDHDQEKSPSEKCWAVPIRLLSSMNYEGQVKQEDMKPRFRTIWLTCEEREKTMTDFPGENHWYIANACLGGLYKVKHDADNWKLLAVALNQPVQYVISEMNRAVLIEEVLAGARNGEVDYKTAFVFLRYLKNELSYLPWRAAKQGLTFIKQNLSRLTGYEEFKSFIAKMVSPIFQKSRNAIDTTDILERIIKDIMEWACEFDYEPCKEVANRFFDRFKRWNQSPRGIPNPLPRHLRRVVYCSGVSRGTDDDFNTLMDFLERSDGDEEELKDIIFGLSCSPNEAILNRYLERTINTDEVFPKSLSTYAFRNVAENDKGFNVALKFLNDNKKFISGSSFSNNPVVEYVAPLAARATSTEELGQIKDLMGSENVQKSSKELEEAYKTAEENMAWLHKNKEPLLDVIKQIDN